MQIDGALSAELMHNCLTVIGQHLIDIRLERMFTKKKVVDMICQFGDLINAERVQSIQILDSNLDQDNQQSLMESFAEQDSF